MTNLIEIDYHWLEGSIPPPDHYEYSINISGNDCKIELQPDYPNDNTPRWIEKFSVENEMINKLVLLLNNVSDKEWIPNGNIPVGDSIEWMNIKLEDNVFIIPGSAVKTDELIKLFSFINSLVPQKIWLKLNALREKYIDEFNQK
ncbi:hypothetical protein ACFLTH_14210 [Bacteroidota bacterium]